MGLTRQDALQVLRNCDFHLYHAKSWNESLFIHSFSAYALVDGALPFTQVYSESDKELMRWAALLHDYGKTSANWQKALPFRELLAYCGAEPERLPSSCSSCGHHDHLPYRELVSSSPNV